MIQASRSQDGELADEMVLSTLTGGYDLIGTLLHQPVLIIFDNQGEVAVGVGNNGTSTWHTFPAGEAIVLDLRDKRAIASNFTFRKGMSFYGIGTAGAALFSISYVYAKEQ